MSMPSDYTGSPSPIDAERGLMGIIGPPPAEDRADATGRMHVNRSTLIVPDEEVAASAASMAYLDEHPEISHIVLSGTDSLALPAARLREILEQLTARDHVRMIRLCTRLPAHSPERVAGDRELLALLADFADPGRSLYVMMRFEHPGEILGGAQEAFRALTDAGAGLVAEVPIAAGVNADPDVLEAILKELGKANVIPYQFVIDRPAADGGPAIALEKAYKLVEAVKTRISGPARRARLKVTHPGGYYEVLAIEHGKAYVKGHLSGDHVNGRFMILDCPPFATGFEDATACKPRKRTGKRPSDATYLKVPYEIPD